MKRFSKLPKDVKTVLIVAAIVISISGLTTIYANVNAHSRLETLKRDSRLNFVSLDEFKTFMTEKEVTALEYDVEMDILTGTLKEEAKIKYGITGSGRVALGNISKFIEENRITNEVILETIKNAEKLYFAKPTKTFISMVVSVVILSVSYLILIKPMRNSVITNPPTSSAPRMIRRN
ncbi:MAG: hypothetical protein GXZ06_02005 [Tissierellia bacterium]|nr:hypothetical protein [Tissierellia bacterium]